MNDERPIEFHILGHEIESYVTRANAGEFTILSMDAGSTDGIAKHNGHYTLHVRYPKPRQAPLLE